MTSIPAVPEAKAQHYIPKFYLKGFTDKQGALWVYEKFKPLRESRPKHEAHRPDYYTHAEDGKRDETAEDVLKATESQVAPIIRKLANPQYVLTPENAARLIVFVAFMFVRVPSWREHLDTLTGRFIKENQLKLARDKERFHKLYATFESTRGKPLGMECEELRQYVLKGEFDVEQKSTAFNLGAMFRSAITITETLLDFGYQGLYAPEGKFFMTSDSPVYTLQPDGKGQATIGVGFGLPGVEVYCPLNKRTCLRMKKGLRPRGTFVERDYVDKINDLAMATATGCLYSNERYKRIARLFDERGCKVRPGKESFLSTPPSGHGRLF
jgi:hypothetical protein